MFVVLLTLCASEENLTVLEIKFDGKNSFIAEKEYMGNKSFNKVVIAHGYEVIGTSAFQNTIVQYAELPTTIHTIRQSAFRNTKLREIVIPSGVETLESLAFADCKNVRRIYISESVTVISNWVFKSCNNSAEWEVDPANERFQFRDWMLIEDNNTINCVVDRFTYFEVPEYISRIAYHGCSGMSQLITANCTCVESMHQYIFRDNANLQTVIFGPRLSNFETLTFDGCKVLKSVFVVGENPLFMDIDGVLYKREAVGVSVIHFPAGLSNTTFTIRNDVSALDGSAFTKANIEKFELENENHPMFRMYEEAVYNTNYTKLIVCPRYINVSVFKFHPSLTYIGDYAFSGQQVITELHIPEGVTEIGTGAFSQAHSIKDFELPQSLKTVNHRSFHNMRFTELVIPPGVTNLSSAVCGWSSVATVDIQGPVTDMGRQCFAQCTALKSINIPLTLQYIGEQAFQKCTDLTEKMLILPEGLTFIGHSAFDGCTGLNNTIVIPVSVAIVDTKAFYMCSNIKEIIVTNCNTFIGTDAFYSGGGYIQSVCIQTKFFTHDDLFTVGESVHHREYFQLAASILSFIDM